MSRQPKNAFPQCHAGCRVAAGATPVLTGNQGVKSVVQVAAGHYTVTLEDEYAIAVGLATVTPETTLAAHPFTQAVTQTSSTVYDVKTVSNGALADTDFQFTVDQAAPVTSVPLP